MEANDAEFALVKLNSRDMGEEITIPVTWLRNASQVGDAGICMYPHFKNPITLINYIKCKVEPTDQFSEHGCQVLKLYDSENKPSVVNIKIPGNDQDRPSTSSPASEPKMYVLNPIDEDEPVEVKKAELSVQYIRFPLTNAKQFNSVGKSILTNSSSKKKVFNWLTSKIGQLNDIKMVVRRMYERLFDPELRTIIVPWQARDYNHITFFGTPFHRLMVEHLQWKFKESEENINVLIKNRISSSKPRKEVPSPMRTSGMASL